MRSRNLLSANEGHEVRRLKESRALPLCFPLCRDLSLQPHHQHLHAQVHAHWPLYREVLTQEAFEKLIMLWGKD